MFILEGELRRLRIERCGIRDAAPCRTRSASEVGGALTYVGRVTRAHVRAIEGEGEVEVEVEDEDKWRQRGAKKMSSDINTCISYF